MRLIVDLDETVTSFIYELVKRYNNKYNKRKQINSIKEYGLPDDMKEIFLESGFFINLMPFPYSTIALRNLQNIGCEIIIASDCLGIPYIAYEKLVWIKNNLPFIPIENIMLINKKSLINGDVIIDDAPKYIETFNGTTIIMDREYNKHVKADYRVNRWIQIEDIIKNLINKQ